MTDSNTLDDNIDAVLLRDEPAPKMTAVIQPAVPAHIAGNILEFMRRVQSNGMEAIAWVEAYTYIQQFVQQPGVPFTGLPAQQPK